jgi:hypothetical protein
MRKHDQIAITRWFRLGNKKTMQRLVADNASDLDTAGPVYRRIELTHRPRAHEQQVLQSGTAFRDMLRWGRGIWHTPSLPVLIYS